MKRKRKIAYEETYSGAKLVKQFLPTLPSANGFEIIECEVRRAGRYDDGTEFQDLRVVLKERA